MLFSEAIGFHPSLFHPPQFPCMLSSTCIPNRFDDRHCTSSGSMDPCYPIPGICLSEKGLKRFGRSFLTIKLCKHYQVCISDAVGQQTIVDALEQGDAYLPCFSVNLVSAPSANTISYSMTLAPSFNAGMRFCKIMTAYLSLQSCKIHRKK